MGTHVEDFGAPMCDYCPVGKYCPDRGMPYAGKCPPGYICLTEQLGTVTQMEPCPEGFYCPDVEYEPGMTDGIRNATICPDGYYCPYGTGQLTPFAGNYSTP